MAEAERKPPADDIDILERLGWVLDEWRGFETHPIGGQVVIDAHAEITSLQAELEAAKRETAEARDKALEEAATLAFSLEDESTPRPWFEDWGQHNNQRTAERVSQEISNAIRALKSNHESKDTQGGT